jgi:hypothetical protein
VDGSINILQFDSSIGCQRVSLMEFFGQLSLVIGGMSLGGDEQESAKGS